MDQLRAMRVFQAVAEQGGFAAAARRLHVSPPTATRAVDTLEAHLGVALLRRTTRAVSLTSAGTAYLELCRRLLADLDDAERLVSGAAVTPTGRLAITAPVQFGKRHVAPLVVEFIRHFPEVRASLDLLDRPVSLTEEGFDMAFRVGQPRETSLVAARLGEVRRVVCASPGYLAARGLPERPRDLGAHAIVELSAMAAFGPIWAFVENGRDVAMRLEAGFSVNNTDVAIAAAIDGVGVTRLLSYQVAEHVAAGRLQLILEAFEQPPVPVRIVLGSGRPASATVRRFVDLAKARLAERGALALPPVAERGKGLP